MLEMKTNPTLKRVGTWRVKAEQILCIGNLDVTGRNVIPIVKGSSHTAEQIHRR